MNKAEFLHWLDQYPITSAQSPRNKPLVMGILNVTPDSFSDGGLYIHTEDAWRRGLEMIDQGADILDIGGESSRPGADSISLEEELSRIIPVIETLVKETDICISIDTCKPEVMRAAVASGASMINDIHGLTKPGALTAAASLNVPVCIMHMHGIPSDMQTNPVYQNCVLTAIHEYFSERITACIQAGMPKTQLILDPGFGFGKMTQDNLKLIKHLEKWHEFGLPILLGVSRKSTIGALLKKTVDHRMTGGLAMAVYAMLNGVGIIRTHDVDETAQALTVIHHIEHS